MNIETNESKINASSEVVFIMPEYSHFQRTDTLSN